LEVNLGLTIFKSIADFGFGMSSLASDLYLSFNMSKSSLAFVLFSSGAEPSSMTDFKFFS
jgi:hypothetical protein